MAEKIQKAFDIQAQVTAGTNGVFDVHVDDKLVYSRASTGTFPDEDALIDELRKQYTS